MKKVGRIEISQDAFLAVLQVELDDVVVNALGRIEDNRADGGFLAPLVEAQVFVLGCAKGVEGGGPGWVGAVAGGAGLWALGTSRSMTSAIA